VVKNIMESKGYMQSLIQNIEKNIFEKINISKLTSKFFISPRQLYRDFYSFTGHSINEYIIKRKLSKTLNLLKYSDISVFKIADICGYSSTQALCRNTKSILNMTPTEYRNSIDIYYFPMYNGSKTKEIDVKTQTMPKTIKVKYLYSELKGIENKAVSYLLSVIPKFNGRLFGKNMMQTDSQFCYELYIEYKESYIEILNKTFGDTVIYPEYTAIYASSSSINQEHDISASWNFLYGYWLKNSMFEQDNIPYFEEYILKDNKVRKLILYLPVKRRENFYKINIMSFEERLFITASKKGEEAEFSASNIVIKFIAKYYPLFLKTQKEYFISNNNGFFTCGLNVCASIKNVHSAEVQTLSIPKGLYAVLESPCFGSGNEYEQILLIWLEENGFDIIGTSFSIYDTSKGTDKSKIAVKAQVMVKDGRI